MSSSRLERLRRIMKNDNENNQPLQEDDVQIEPVEQKNSQNDQNSFPSTQPMVNDGVLFALTRSLNEGKHLRQGTASNLYDHCK